MLISKCLVFMQHRAGAWVLVFPQFIMGPVCLGAASERIVWWRDAGLTVIDRLVPAQAFGDARSCKLTGLRVEAESGLALASDRLHAGMPREGHAHDDDCHEQDDEKGESFLVLCVIRSLPTMGHG